MRSSSFQAITRRFTLALPLFMGAIEYLLRVGFVQPDKEAFFPISLVAAGVSLNVAVTMLPRMSGIDHARWLQTKNDGLLILIANLGVFASLIGALLWLDMLLASFSAEVRAILPLHPLREAAFYYIFSCMVTEWKASLESP
jgi:hypothetical protein